MRMFAICGINIAVAFAIGLTILNVWEPGSAWQGSFAETGRGSVAGRAGDAGAPSWRSRPRRVVAFAAAVAAGLCAQEHRAALRREHGADRRRAGHAGRRRDAVAEAGGQGRIAAAALRNVRRFIVACLPDSARHARLADRARAVSRSAWRWPTSSARPDRSLSRSWRVLYHRDCGRMRCTPWSTIRSRPG